MPTNQLSDPGAYGGETVEDGITTRVFVATGAILKGHLVNIVTETVFSATSPLKAKKSTTTASFLMVGIARNNATTGQLVQVITTGLAKALCKTNTVKGLPVLATGTNAGLVKTTATAVLGKTIGISMTTTTSTTTHFIIVNVGKF